MKRKRYTEEQIVKILENVESGKSVATVARETGVSEQTIFRWKNQYGGIDQAELRRLKELLRENSRLKKMVADQTLDIDALKDLLGKEW